MIIYSKLKQKKLRTVMGIVFIVFELIMNILFYQTILKWGTKFPSRIAYGLKTKNSVSKNFLKPKILTQIPKWSHFTNLASQIARKILWK